MKNVYLIQLDVDKNTELFLTLDSLMNQLYSSNDRYLSFKSQEEAELFWNKNSWMLDYYDTTYKNVKSASVVKVSYEECLKLAEPDFIPPNENLFQDYDNLLKWFDESDYKNYIQKQETDICKSFKIEYNNLIIYYEHNIDVNINLYYIVINHKSINNEFKLSLPWDEFNFLCIINSLDYMNSSEFIEDYNLYCKQNLKSDKLLDLFNFIIN